MDLGDSVVYIASGLAAASAGTFLYSHRASCAVPAYIYGAYAALALLMLLYSMYIFFAVYISKKETLQPPVNVDATSGQGWSWDRSAGILKSYGLIVPVKGISGTIQAVLAVATLVFVGLAVYMFFQFRKCIPDRSDATYQCTLVFLILSVVYVIYQSFRIRALGF
jgi:hypothetical protein